MFFHGNRPQVQKNTAYKPLAGALFISLCFGLSILVSAGNTEIVEGKGKFAGMVLIPAGPFTMGRDDGPPDEAPAHEVFYLISISTKTW